MNKPPPKVKSKMDLVNRWRINAAKKKEREDAKKVKNLFSDIMTKLKLNLTLRVHAIENN
jgi:hypothetical protein